jgi:hypothetical protein
VLAVVRDHGNRSRVTDDLALGDRAIGEAKLVLADGRDRARVDDLR